MTIPEFYRQTGGNYADAIERFQNDALISRFLRMLPRDESMAQLTQAMEAQDAERAFRAVHTLKGVSLNLALASLAKACSEMTEALRGSSVLPANAPALYEAVRQQHEGVLSALAQLDA